MAIETPSHQLYPSPLRYPGGKGKLANYIKLILLENGLVGSEYVEPYAGGASVALSLLFEEYVSHIHINDINRSVYAFWNVAVSDTDALCSRIESAKVTVKEWDRQRRIQAAREPTELDLAFSTFFLNRTNRSGIITGGIIGGRHQTGPWKIGARWKPSDLVARIRKIARFSSRISVTNLDASEFLDERLPLIDSAFLYLDPPYYGKGRRLYENFYEHADHADIAQRVQQLEVPWVVSYDAVSEITDLYREAQRLRYGLRYTARERVEGSEVMFFSPHLEIPEQAEPAATRPGRIAQAQVAHCR